MASDRAPDVLFARSSHMHAPFLASPHDMLVPSMKDEEVFDALFVPGSHMRNCYVLHSRQAVSYEIDAGAIIGFSS
jgi:hypothetical protein